jgi:hypothetical protein
LNEKFAYMGTILRRQKSFPSFTKVKNDLMVKEISMAKSTAPSQALVATTPHPLAVGPTPSGSVPMQQPKKKNKNKKNSGPTWPSFYNIRGQASFRCGPEHCGGLCLACVLLAHSSSTEGLLRRSSPVRVISSRHSLEGLLGLHLVGRAFSAACCQRPLASYLG